MTHLTEHIWKILAGAVSTAFIGLLIFIIWPITADGIENMQQKTVLQQRIDRGTDWQETTGEINQERAQLKSFFTQVTSNSPSGEGMAHTLETLFKLADNAAVSIQKITPLKSIEEDFYKEVPIDILFTGSYHSMAYLLNDIEQLGYWIEPKQIQLYSNQSGRGALDAHLTLSVYQIRLPNEN